ncbi:MAG: hypothetical protein AB203_00970 [Parcubacteria bacterium C7867-008]|nr:MAG: hypothetical protein AB203_00970 [Parcubacteria bacterium C7867-008]
MKVLLIHQGPIHKAVHLGTVRSAIIQGGYTHDVVDGVPHALCMLPHDDYRVIILDCTTRPELAPELTRRLTSEMRLMTREPFLVLITDQIIENSNGLEVTCVSADHFGIATISSLLKVYE